MAPSTDGVCDVCGVLPAAAADRVRVVRVGPAWIELVADSLEDAREYARSVLTDRQLPGTHLELTALPPGRLRRWRYGDRLDVRAEVWPVPAPAAGAG